MSSLVTVFAQDRDHVDFNEAQTNNTNWAFNRVKFYANKTNNAYLWTSDCSIVSPRYSNPVAGISISCMASSERTQRRIEVTLLDCNGNEVDGGTRELVPPVERGIVGISLGGGSGVHQFVIGASSGEGNIHLYDCTVLLDGGAAPEELVNEKVTGSSFVGAWKACDGADFYLVDLYRVDETPSAWSCAKIMEDFGAAANAGGNPVQIEEIGSLFASLDGSRVYVPAHTNGLVQIGTGSKAGWLALSGCAVENGDALIFRAQRYLHNEEGRVMSLYWTDGVQTNSFDSVTLCDEMTDYEVPLAEVPEGACVMLRSTKSTNGRVWLDSVAVVSGYRPASVATNLVVGAKRAANARCRFTGLEKGATYLWGVRSVCGGDVSSCSELVQVVPDGDPDMPGFSVMVR